MRVRLHYTLGEERLASVVDVHSVDNRLPGARDLIRLEGASLPPRDEISNWARVPRWAYAHRGSNEKRPPPCLEMAILYGAQVSAYSRT